MKKIITIIGLLSICSATFASQQCNVESKLANTKVSVLDRSLHAGAQLSDVIEEAELEKKNGIDLL
jgi:hypothetical protein